MRAELKKHVRAEIGPIATPEIIQFAAGQTEAHDFGDTSTFADPSVVDDLVANSKEFVGKLLG